MGELNARELGRHIEAVDAFLKAYDEYLKDPTDEARNHVLDTIPSADRAIASVRGTLSVTDATGFTRSGLANLAFDHEQLPSSHHQRSWQMVIDSTRRARAALADRLEEVTRRRRSPLYWADKAVDTLLRIPAYLVSKIVRVPMSSIDSGGLGTVLRAIAVIADVGGVWAVGRALDFW